MSDHREIYRKQASAYEFMVSLEDHQKNLPRALAKLRPFDGLDVVELGAGTGRLTRMMAPFAKTILVSDISCQRLDVATAMLEKTVSWPSILIRQKAGGYVGLSCDCQWPS